MSLIFQKVGKIKENPWGDWSDVDKGLYLDGERLISAPRGYGTYCAPNIFDDLGLVGRKIKITIEILPDDYEEE